MKSKPSDRKDLTAEQKTEVLLDTVIDVLHKVVKRHDGTGKVTDIRAALDNLIANKQDAVALSKAMSYCTDNWILGPAN